MNREMRRLQQKEEERARKRRKQAPQRGRKERVGVREFLQQSRQELRKVAWPSRQETLTYTVVVITVTTFVTLYTFVLDFVLKSGVLRFLDTA